MNWYLGALATVTVGCFVILTLMLMARETSSIGYEDTNFSLEPNSRGDAAWLYRNGKVYFCSVSADRCKRIGVEY